MPTTTTDLAYGRQGGRIVKGAPTIPGPARHCEVCGGRMVVGQSRRHAACSPPLPCCGWPEDLVADRAYHEAQHADPTLPPTERKR